MAELFWLIPLIPGASALLLILFGMKLSRRWVAWQAASAVFLSFLLSTAAFVHLIRLPPCAPGLTMTLLTWISSGSFASPIAFAFDHLTAVMALVVTGVGLLIHVYSTAYMAEDRSFSRYFAHLNLFTFFMLILIMASGLVLMFVGWEGVGLCSYLLIGFWFEKQSASDAGKKAFIVNRIGDFGFLLGIFIIFWQVGSLDFKAVFAAASTAFVAGGSLITAACLLLFLGATGKSAQIPLYVWLPDAMEGPTPVSALIHAATMVTAGVYMIVRSNVLYTMAPTALSVVAVTGATTALFAATIGLAQNDIKRVLAYSTVSQLGYMFLACGVAAYSAGIFHLMTHAFFKALLFLGSGSVIHAMSGEQDMRKMGGLKKHLRITYATFVIATLAIAGIPGLSGFFSKDEILWQAFSSGHGSAILWVMGVVTAALTAFYMFRVVYLTFHGSERMDVETKRHIHESPRSMTVPLMVLAGLSIVGGYIGMPELFGARNYFAEWLAPVIGGVHEDIVINVPASGGGDSGMEMTLMFITVILAVLAILMARHFYLKKPEAAASLSGKFGGIQKVLLNKYYVDEVYGVLIVRPLVGISTFLWKIIDVIVIDGSLNGGAWLYARTSDLLRYGQSGRVRSYATIFVAGVVILLGYLALR